MAEAEGKRKLKYSVGNLEVVQKQQQDELYCFSFIWVKKESRRDIFTFMEALEDSGTPFSYLPVIIPHAKGDQDTTPTP